MTDAIKPVIDVAHLTRQREWSRATFGPGPRTKGVCDHIRKELREVEAEPEELSEWADVIILGFDGAWRAGWEPEDILNAILLKQWVNEGREWPDWRGHEDQAIEHVRDGDQPLPTKHDGPVVQELVRDDIEARLQVGIQRYGTGLQANNGRDMTRDAYEEALDLATYLRGMLLERDGA